MDLDIQMLMQKPAFQALVFLVLTPLVIFLSQPKSAESAWVVAAYTYGIFLLLNAALLWFNDSPWIYFIYSIGVSIAYLGCIAIIMKGTLKVLQLKESGESAMAFLIIIYQPFALLLVMSAKWVLMRWL